MAQLKSNTTGNPVDFSFCHTSDLDLPLKIKVYVMQPEILTRFRCNLEGNPPEIDLFQRLENPYLDYACRQTEKLDLMISMQLWAHGKPVTLPIQTSHKSPKVNGYVWNEWIQFPMKFRDLPLETQLLITVWDAREPRKPHALGACRFQFFDGNNVLKTGRIKLFVWPNTIPSLDTPVQAPISTDLDRIEDFMRDYERGDVPRVDWLDKLTFREIERMNEKQTKDLKALYLHVELLKFDFPLVFNEKEYPTSSLVARFVDSDIVTISDPDAFMENLAEEKHRKLVRSHRNGAVDRDLKPNARLRDELQNIIQYPPTQQLTNEEEDLVWKFRYFLTRDRKAVTKFCKSVVWTDAVEAKQATELLPLWTDIDVEDALELLGPSFQNRSVRSFAVSQLRKADDDDLQLYLVQLVQALKFEGLVGEGVRILDSPLAHFLIQRSVRNPVLGNYFHWYLTVECEDKTWGNVYARVAYQFMTSLSEQPQGSQRREVLRRQGELVATLLGISKELRIMKDPRPKKVERLRHIINDPRNGLLNFAPMPLPMDANVEITGIIPEKTNIFRSVLMPLRVTFRCQEEEYPVIFKAGDDLRQDQLVIQIITLMDKLLRKENLDLKLTPYRVLATGENHGLVQFIPSFPLATIIAEYGSMGILNYLRKHNADDSPTAIFGVNATVMDTYLKSCAAYSVITYLLGVGDRHLDNLLLTPNGELFHVDFSYIFGRDPKPFPPPMKLCKEMIEAMGGTNSTHYQRFRSYCFIAFTILRKSANLILNLLALMVNSTIPDIALEPDKVVLKVQEKFRLDLNDEEAIQHFQMLINESVNALFPQVMEKIHQFAQYWRG